MKKSIVVLASLLFVLFLSSTAAQNGFHRSTSKNDIVSEKSDITFLKKYNKKEREFQKKESRVKHERIRFEKNVAAPRDKFMPRNKFEPRLKKKYRKCKR